MTLKALITIGLAAIWMTLGAHAATAAVEPSAGGSADGTIPTVPVSAPDAVVSTQIEWLQVGIGFGIGMFLAFGLLLTLRVAHVRPLAH